MNSYKENVIKSYQKVEDKIGWESLHQILKIMWEFISSVERDLAAIAHIFPNFYIAHSKLLDINSETSNKLAYYLFNRVTETCPLALSILAYLLTPDGLKMYKENVDLQEPSYNSVKESLKVYTDERFIPKYIDYDYQTSLKNYFNFIEKFFKYN